jgi:hypothetical protein
MTDLDNDDEPGPCPRCRGLDTTWVGDTGDALCITCGFVWDGCERCCLACGKCWCKCDE